MSRNSKIIMATGFGLLTILGFFALRRIFEDMENEDFYSDYDQLLSSRYGADEQHGIEFL